MKRVSLFCGHFGSGKTNLAVNYAFFLKEQGLPVAIADLDIVNPYFRTKDSEDELKAAGIDVISLPFANSNVDLPSVPSQVYGLVQRTDRYAVLDIGGDEDGAFALGRYAPYLLEENNFDLFFVVNFFRPLTRTAEDALVFLREIEAASHLSFTGIINNSNLGRDTTAETLLSSTGELTRLAELSGLPVCWTSADQKLVKDLEGKVENLFPLHLQKRATD